ncbi:MAG TPA: hypothetical protein VFN84_03040 [Pseudolabrys sp.]|nr:hypothetical protein [Pseudolabrys sp.]
MDGRTKSGHDDIEATPATLCASFRDGRRQRGIKTRAAAARDSGFARIRSRTGMTSPLSLPGLTRQSIGRVRKGLMERIFRAHLIMVAQVKPAHDVSAAVR